jgi:hypothetical protein
LLIYVIPSGVRVPEAEVHTRIAERLPELIDRPWQPKLQPKDEVAETFRRIEQDRVVDCGLRNE